MEWELWEKIKIEEFIDLNWTKKDKETVAPHGTIDIADLRCVFISFCFLQFTFYLYFLFLNCIV
jgi:hypothetical protein